MFSICIPNYNYEKYLGVTLKSAFNQTFKNFEVVISDNCSTDGSIDIIRTFDTEFPSQLKWSVNDTNVGFSPNLDQAARLASRDYMIMLSSDDVIDLNALETYNRVLSHIPNPTKVIMSSAIDIIDAYDNVIKSPRARDFRFNVWRESDIDESLTKLIGYTVYKVSTRELLKRSLNHCTNPFNFCTTCYHVSAYKAIGGYGGGRMINPDKWFHWRLLSKAEFAVFIDAPLFQYRWHANNQTAQQKSTGYLKYLIDEYRNTIEIDQNLLEFANLTKHEFEKSFVSTDIIRHGLGEFRRGLWLKSLRIFLFGWSVYPKRMISIEALFYLVLLATTPLGAWLISKWFSVK